MDTEVRHFVEGLRLLHKFNDVQVKIEMYVYFIEFSIDYMKYHICDDKPFNKSGTLS